MQKGDGMYMLWGPAWYNISIGFGIYKRLQCQAFKTDIHLKPFSNFLGSKWEANDTAQFLHYVTNYIWLISNQQYFTNFVWTGIHIQRNQISCVKLWSVGFITLVIKINFKLHFNKILCLAAFYVFIYLFLWVYLITPHCKKELKYIRVNLTAITQPVH